MLSQPVEMMRTGINFQPSMKEHKLGSTAHACDSCQVDTNNEEDGHVTIHATYSRVTEVMDLRD